MALTKVTSNLTSFDSLLVDSNNTDTTITIESDLDGSSLFTSGIDLKREGTSKGSRIESIRDASTGGVGLKFLTTADNAAEVSGTLTSRMVILEDGNVGIGTSSPSRKFVVKDTTTAHIKLTESGLGESVTDGLDMVIDYTGTGYLLNRESASLHLGTSNTNRLSIDPSGNVGIGTSSPVAKLHVIDDTNGSGEDEGMVIRGNASNGGITNNASLLGLNAAASNSSNYRMIQCNSNTTTSTVDAEFIVFGNGNVVADGTFSGNGADYAEFFESTDGTAIPRGTSIVIENGKVRAATSEDDVTNIIGVARPKEDGTNSMVIGNTAWNNWTNKYLTDDFGVFIMEEFTSVYWTDEDGKYHWYQSDRVPEGIVVPDDAEYETHNELGNPLVRRTLNPDYDISQAYIPRLERDEWIIVGLMGQVQILKGQPVNDRWIKMRDISDTVEEWYIR